MVVSVRIRHAEADGHLAQEWNRSVRSPDRREIIAQAEDELVDTWAQGVPGQEGAIGSALGVGAHDVQALTRVSLGVDSIELDGHSCRRAAMNRIEYVRSQASSHRQHLLIEFAVAAYLRRMARVNRP